MLYKTKYKNIRQTYYKITPGVKEISIYPAYQYIHHKLSHHTKEWVFGHYRNNRLYNGNVNKYKNILGKWISSNCLQ